MGEWDVGREKHFQVLTVFLNLDWPGQTSAVPGRDTKAGASCII